MTSTPTALLAGADRAAWLAERRTGIGSSDVAAIAGMNPWSSALEVYLSKLGLEEDERTNERMNWGNRLEAVVADHFASLHDFDVSIPDGMIRSKALQYMCANVDRFLSDPVSGTVGALLEIKTSGAHMAEHWADEPPDYVQLQVQHQLAVTGLSHAWVAVLLGGQDYREYEVERDDGVIASLVTIEGAFWNDHVLAKVPPAPDASRSASEALQRLYADFEKESEVDLPPEARALIEAYRDTKRDIANAKDDERRQSNAIKALIGEFHVGMLDGTPAVKWSRWTQQRLNRDALEADHPDLVARYLVDDQRDRLTLTKESK